jgi:hypothetical protein
MMIQAKLDQMRNQLVHHDEYKIDELNLDWKWMIMDRVDHSNKKLFTKFDSMKMKYLRDDLIVEEYLLFW